MQTEDHSPESQAGQAGVATSSQEHTAVVAPQKGWLINRNFTLLAIGQGISNMGDFVYSTTLLVWVFALTHSAAAVSGILIAQYAPTFVLGPIAGVFVDRWNRRQTMLISDLARTLLALLPLLAPFTLRLPMIYASVFLIACFSRFFTPAKSGLLQAIVSSEQQGQAASISQATFALAIIVGPALATPLYFAVGPVIAISINALSFLVSAICVFFIAAPRAALHPYAFSQHEQRVNQLQAIWHELWLGLRFVVTTRIILMVVLMALIVMLGAGGINALDIIFVSHNLHVSTLYYGPLAMVSGIGTLVGAILAGLLIRKIKPQRMLTASVFLVGIGIILYSLQSWYVAAIIVTLIMTIPQGGIDVGAGPLIINSTPQAMMGRVMAVFETCMFGVSLLSAALAGYLGQILPVSLIFALGGILIMLGGLFGWFAIPNTTPVTQAHPQVE